MINYLSTTNSKLTTQTAQKAFSLPNLMYKKLASPSKLTALIAAATMMLVSVPSQADTLADKIAQLNSESASISNQSSPLYLQQSFDNIADKYLPILAMAEEQSSGKALRVLQNARQMTLDERRIVVGSCWDYLNAVFQQSGATRQKIHEGVYQQGPYADGSQIQAGDWLYYVNHSYHDIEHSGMFIGWVDEAQNQALILSYGGEHRQEPARYRVYDISHVYQVIRPS